MNILEIVIMVVLVIIIVRGVSIQSDIHSIVGGVPGTIIILFIVFYLFTISPILGVFAMIAGYEVVMNTKSNKTFPVLEELPSQVPFTSTNQFQITLEETIVKNIAPIVQSITPAHLNFKSTQDNTYAAANAV
jgi:hypothetical protein